MNLNRTDKRLGAKVKRSANSLVISPRVQAALVRFVEYHPPNRFSRNLRKMLLEFLLTQGAGEGLYFQELLYDLEGLFELMDEIEGDQCG
jgi:hypothetical protein